MKTPDDVYRDARFLRGAGTGGEKNGLDVHLPDGLHGDGVVAVNSHVPAHLRQVLDEVVGKGIVIVDHQNHLGFSL